MVKAETIINRAEEFLNLDNNREIKNTFLEKYTLCEVLTRPLVRSYLLSINEECPNEYLLNDYQTIKDAIADCGYFFADTKLLSRIWSQKKEPGESSCRFLRNKITHELMFRALKEVVERKIELLTDMDKYIKTLLDN